MILVQNLDLLDLQKVRDAKSGQHGQRACAIFPPSCANFWPVYAQNLLSLSNHPAQVDACTISTAVQLGSVHTILAQLEQQEQCFALYY